MQWSPPSQGPRAAQGWAASRDFVGGTLLPPQPSTWPKCCVTVKLALLASAACRVGIQNPPRSPHAYSPSATSDFWWGPALLRAGTRPRVCTLCPRLSTRVHVLVHAGADTRLSTRVCICACPRVCLYVLVHACAYTCLSMRVPIRACPRGCGHALVQAQSPCIYNAGIFEEPLARGMTGGQRERWGRRCG